MLKDPVRDDSKLTIEQRYCEFIDNGVSYWFAIVDPSEIPEDAWYFD